MLSWTAGKIAGRSFYLRQLHDMKFSPEIEDLGAEGLKTYARLCGRTLARAHARSGDASTAFGYLGDDDSFDQAIRQFAKDYANQSESDYEAVRQAADAGRIEVKVVD